MPNPLIDPLRLERPDTFEWPDEDDRKPAPRVSGSRKRRASSITALLVALVAAVVMVPAAIADDDDDDDGGGGGGTEVLVFTQPVSQACTPDATPQRCDPRFLVAFSGEADRVQFDVSPAHCSAISVELFVNGVSQGASPFLAFVGGPPAPSSFSWDVNLDAGDVVELQATGTPGGCNAGALISWGGTVTIYDQVGGGDDDGDDGDDDGDDGDDDGGDDD